jgi:hypothetical protein
MEPGFRLNPKAVEHTAKQPRILILPPESISLVTTMELKSDDWGLTE